MTNTRATLCLPLLPYRQQNTLHRRLPGVDTNATLSVWPCAVALSRTCSFAFLVASEACCTGRQHALHAQSRISIHHCLGGKASVTGGSVGRGCVPGAPNRTCLRSAQVMAGRQGRPATMPPVTEGILWVHEFCCADLESLSILQDMRSGSFFITLLLSLVCVALSVGLIVVAHSNQKLQSELQGQQQTLNNGILGQQGQQVSNSLLQDMANAGVRNPAMQKLLDSHGYHVQPAISPTATPRASAGSVTNQPADGSDSEHKPRRAGNRE